jgi:flagellar basal body-associated protein FliL
MNLNNAIILVTILIVCAIGGVGAFFILSGDVVTIDINSSVGNETNETNITDQTNTPTITGNNSSSNSSTPEQEINEEPPPPEEPEEPEQPIVQT